MATKLCCTADEDGRSASPNLPTARVSDATPAKRPLLHQRAGSQGSRFTSARSEDLHELRQIFNSAEDPSASPEKPSRTRFLRPSVYSLHSLQKIKSVQGLLKGKRSRDLARAPQNVLSKKQRAKENAASMEPDTVLRLSRDGPNLQVKVTKSDLRKDLLSDKLPEEGGYDPDAEVLDDIARNLAKRSPSKRPSLHSIDWTSSPGNQRTPKESSKAYQASVVGRTKSPYHLRQSDMRSTTPCKTRFSNVFSTPNLRRTPKSRDKNLRRSHSATSIGFAPPSPLPSIRLPSLKANDPDGVPWALSLHESLRLSQFPVHTDDVNSKLAKSPPKSKRPSVGISDRNIFQVSTSIEKSDAAPPEVSTTASEAPTPEVHVQEAAASPRVSLSNKEVDTVEQPQIPRVSDVSGESCQDRNPRHSVHLYSMRISHHLRSGSLLSWDNLAEVPELAPPPPILHDRAISDQRRGRLRHERQTSSSGFTSTKVPSKWGKVIPPSQQREEVSSIYSSRPHSPPDSFGGSLGNLSFAAAAAKRNGSSSCTTLNLPKSRFEEASTDNEETQKLAKRHGPTPLAASETVSSNVSLLDPDQQGPARNNSVATTKRSKFREEFSPPPPRKRSTPTMSIMKMLRPRNSLRSHSEANLRAVNANVDGPFDTPQPAAHRHREMAQAVTSMQREQRAIGKEKEANPVWERALKTHQEERSSLFLPANRNLAVQATPFRERSKSIHSLSPSPSKHEVTPTATGAPTPSTEEPVAGPSVPNLATRRSALIGVDETEQDSSRELQAAFDKQTDTIETVGAWGRYPSHTRSERTSSAGHPDSVKTRDFALEAAVQVEKEEDEIDPMTRPESPPSAGGKKRKKKVGSGRMAKSNSMTFGKTFLKNYTRIFRSQSTEFQRHGHGRRSSIAAGGNLEYPELELLPTPWTGPILEDKEKERSKEGLSGDDNDTRSTAQRSSTSETTPDATPKAPGRLGDKGKGKQRADDSKSTLRQANMDVDTNLTLDGVAEEDIPTDRARVWSVYYGNCIPAYPRPSMEYASISQPNLSEIKEVESVVELRDFGAGLQTKSRRHSFDSKRASLHSKHSRSFASKFSSAKHSRHASRLSAFSVASVVPSFMSMSKAEGEEAEDEQGELDEKKSIVSVRKSTLDLISLYRQQEILERERVLRLMRGESVRVA